MRRFPLPLLGWLRFFITLLLIGFSAFEILSYRWGIASVVLIIFGLFSGCDFRLKRKDLAVVFALSLLRGKHGCVS